MSIVVSVSLTDSKFGLGIACGVFVRKMLYPFTSSALSGVFLTTACLDVADVKASILPSVFTVKACCLARPTPYGSPLSTVSCKFLGAPFSSSAESPATLTNVVKPSEFQS